MPHEGSETASHLTPPLESRDIQSQPSGPQPATLECDHRGRVVRLRDSLGQSAQFRYDADGRLYAFTYAKMAWTGGADSAWQGGDQNGQYRIDGVISVDADGTIRVQRSDLTRLIKVDRTVIDYLPDGQMLRRNCGPDAQAQDLLAELEPGPDTADLKDLPDVWQNHGESGLPTIARLRAVSSAHHIQEVTGTSRIATARAIEGQDVKIGQRFLEAICEELIHLVQSAFGDWHICLPPLLDVAAQACFRRRNMQVAYDLHQRALSIRRRHRDWYHQDCCKSLNGLATISRDSARFSEAEYYYLEAARCCEDTIAKMRFFVSIDIAKPGAGDKWLLEHLRVLYGLSCLYSEHRKEHLCERMRQKARSSFAQLSEERIAAAHPILDKIEAMATKAATARQISQPKTAPMLSVAAAPMPDEVDIFTGSRMISAPASVPVSTTHTHTQPSRTRDARLA